MGAWQTSRVEDDHDRREVRIALSMNGGVSLAVWIGGAVCEVDLLRRGEGFWGDLLEACGYSRSALVDVMAGASAGGLNAVLLAQSIRSNYPFGKFLALWQDFADIDLLVKSPTMSRRVDRRAVFDGEFFLEKLNDALAQAEQSATADPPDQDLAVFASATLVRADPVEFHDVPGTPIREGRSDAYFHVAKRGSHERGLDGFAIDHITSRLARVGRATSSLPGLFEPMRFGADEFASALVNAFEPAIPSVEIMDGGVVDNIPISRAIRAIFTSPADRRVRRVLLYLHPDPGGAVASTDPANATAVVRSFFGKRSESIREDIELLRSHNDAVARRDTEARAILETLLLPEAQAPLSALARSAIDDLRNAATKGLLLRAAVDPSAVLHWHAPDRRRLAPLVDIPGGLTKDALSAALDSLVNAQPDVLVAEYTHRQTAALDRVIWMALDEGAAVPPGHFGAQLQKLNELTLLCLLMSDYQLSRMLDPTDANTTATDRLSRSCAELNALSVMAGLTDSTWRALASWDLSRHDQPVERTTVLRQELERRLHDIVSTLAAPLGGNIGCDILRSLVRGDLGIERLADALLPLYVEPVASDQHIDFVRVAGDVDTPAAGAFNGIGKASGERIAGKQLHHLGAFLRREWRTNDWRWGRLDSVDALIDAIIDDEALARLESDPAKLGLPQSSVAGAERRAQIKEFLVRKRQGQQLVEFLGLDPAVGFEEATRSAAFGAWAHEDRRLSSILGGRALTSAAMRGTTTAAKVFAPTTLVKRSLVAMLRPLLLAVTGLLLAWRWAAASMVWTLCVLAAIRCDSAVGRWAFWGLGLGTALVVGVYVERSRKFSGGAPSWLLPYAFAAAGCVIGALAICNRTWLHEHDVPLLHWNLWWVLPATAAAIGAATLFFWMNWWAWAVLTALVFAFYGWVAFAAIEADAGRGLGAYPDAWPFHSMWVCWLIAVVATSLAIGLLPEKLLKPRAS